MATAGYAEGLLFLISWGGFLAALALTWFLLRIHLREAKARGWGHPVREQGPAAHLSKEGTPTAAGWTFLPGAGSTMLLFPQSFSLSILLAAAIGWADDAAKLRGRREGVPGRWRLVLQVAVGAGLAWALRTGGLVPTLWPWLADNSFVLYMLVHGLAFAAVVNAVNFTDGADGLLAATLGGAVLGLGTVSLVVGWEADINTWFGSHAMLPLAGVLLAWWLVNRHPAQAFMGETGSYLLGAWVFALAFEDPVLLLALTALPLWELLSVVIQVVSFRTTGRRVFRMAPFHHHLELSGWTERRLAGAAFRAQFILTFGILALRGALA